MLPVKRKSVEPMAAHLSPDGVRSEHQRLHHFVADASWSDRAVLDTVRIVNNQSRRRTRAPANSLKLPCKCLRISANWYRCQNWFWPTPGTGEH
jgi:hypothetical protein